MGSARSYARRPWRTAAASLLCLALALAAPAAAARHGDASARLSLSLHQVATKSEATATGKVSPAPAHGRVVLQLRDGRSWRRLARGALERGGSFKLHLTIPADLVSAQIRALAFDGRHRVSVSAVRSLHLRRSSSAPTIAPTPSSTAPTSPLPTENPLSAASLMATIESYASRPDHLSGTAGSAAALDEFSAALQAAGLTPGEQAFTFPRFTPTAIGLTAGGTSVPRAAIAPLLYSGKTGAAGVTAQLFDGGNGTFEKTAVAGKIVVASIAYEHNSKAINLDSAIEKAVEGGAVGFVAVTQAVGDYPKWEDTNARRETGPLPVLMVGKRSGAAVITAAEHGEQGTLALAAETTGTSCDRDVWGELEGADPSRRVFIGVPASSYTPSASEHGTGVAITIGLARYYAALPKSARPETLVFMALGGHEIGWLGLQALLASPYGTWFKEADAYVHLGSALGAPIAQEEPDGTIVTTPTPDPTGRLHDSENPLLEHSVIEDFAAAGVPTPETPPHTASGGEQTNAYAAGIPTASFSGASLYFHTAGDLPSTVDPTILAADAEAFRRTVDTITAIPAGLLKADNAHAAQLGSEINAAERAPSNPTLGSPKGTLGEGGVGGPAATPVAACS
jgi:hypothetical protein